MTLNPFRPGAGHTPPEFAGRQEPLNTFTNILRRTEIGAISRGMMLYGLRGMGKPCFCAVCRKTQNVPDG